MPATSPRSVAPWQPRSRLATSYPTAATYFVGTLNAQGHKLQVLQVAPAVYDGFYPGAQEIREMFQYFAEHTYFGPEHERYIAAANALVPGGFTNFADWARAHMKAV